MIRTLLLASLLVGCGHWTEYDGAPAELPPVEVAEVDDVLAAIGALPRLDHLLFEGLLSRYISEADGQSYVDYDRWTASEEAGVLFAQYLGLLAAVDPTALAGRAEKMAFWFNAYNALTIQGVLTQYEGDPGWSVSRGLFVFFDQRVFVVGGLQVSLNQIEHGVLRGVADHASLADLSSEDRAQLAAWHTDLWGEAGLDPRLHVAINCASLGCPNVVYAFSGAEVEAQLAAATQAFLDNPSKGAGPDGISQLFNWFEPDFSLGGYDGPADFIERGRSAGLEGVDLDTGLPYLWTLNITP
jgi:hypothetical protein